MNGPYIYFEIPIFGGIPITQTAVSSFLIMVALCVAGILLGRGLQKRPSRKQVIVEKLVTMLYDLVEGTMGKHNAPTLCGASIPLSYVAYIPLGAMTVFFLL